MYLCGCVFGGSGSIVGKGGILAGCTVADLDRSVEGEGCVVAGCVTAMGVDANFSRLLGWTTVSACEDFFA